MTALTTSLIIIAILFALAYITSPKGFRERFLAEPHLGPVDFKTLDKSARPNQYLLCQREFCKNSVPDAEPPTYDIPVVALKTKWKEMMQNQRAEVVNETALTIDYITRSPIMGFPDSISVEFFKVDKNHSTIGIYARAHKGYFDFGTNAKRVRRWMKRLNMMILYSKST